MKKVLISLILLIICAPVFAEDVPWLYRQSSSPTTTTNTTNTTNTIQTDKNIKIKMRSGTSNKIIRPVIWKTSSQSLTTDVTSNSENNVNYTNETNSQVSYPISNTNKQNNGVRNVFGSKNDYLYVENEVKSNNENLIAIANQLLANISDPYMVKINGKKYYIVKNSKNGIYNFNNIVGYRDKKDSLFTSLRQLNTDSDTTKLSASELKMQNIRFVQVNHNGKLQLNNSSSDYNLDNVLYIDLKNVRESINKGAIGSFGYFDMYIKDQNGRPKKIIGCVTFETDEELKTLMGIK